MGTKTLYRLVSRFTPPSPAVPVDTVLAVEADRDRALAVFGDVVAEIGDSYGPASQYRLLVQPAAVQS